MKSLHSNSLPEPMHAFCPRSAEIGVLIAPVPTVDCLPGKEGQMNSRIRSSETPAALLERAADCLEIAQAQHDAADRQHHAADVQNLHADKLDELARSLEASAIKIEGKAQMDACRSRL